MEGIMFDHATYGRPQRGYDNNHFLFEDRSVLGQAQAILGAILGSTLVAILVIFMANMSREDYSGVPTVTAVQLDREFTEFVRLTHKPATDPIDYFRAVRLERKVDRDNSTFRNQNADNRIVLERHAVFSPNGDLMDMQARYLAQFGPRMHEAADRYGPALYREAAELPKPRSYFDWPRMLRGFVMAGVFSLIVALLFFMVRLKVVGLRIWPELFTPALAVAVFAWPIQVWRYPHRISPVEQMRRARRYLVGLVTTALTFGAATAASASERKSDGQSQNGTTLVLKDRPKPAATLTSGIAVNKLVADGKRVHDGPYAFGDLFVSYGDWSVDFAYTRAASGSKGSDENDFVIGRAFKQQSWKATVKAAYYDIRPLAREKGGDMLSPIVSVEHPVGKFTAFGTAEAYFLTGGKPGRNGFDVSAGARTTIPIGKVSADLSAQAIYADGPFNFERGVSLRGDAKVRVPVTRKLSAFLAGKVFQPIMGAKDRHLDASASAGLAFSF